MHTNSMNRTHLRLIVARAMLRFHFLIVSLFYLHNRSKYGEYILNVYKLIFNGFPRHVLARHILWVSSAKSHFRKGMDPSDVIATADWPDSKMNHLIY